MPAPPTSRPSPAHAPEAERAAVVPGDSPATPPITLAGRALHSGETSSVTLSRHDGPLLIEQAGVSVALERLDVVGTYRGVTVEGSELGSAARLRIDLVEHLLAAFGGLGVREGVRVLVAGAEIPLLDGGARRFADALLALGAPPSPPRLRVLRAATLERGRSVYRFEPGDRVSIEADVDLPPPVGCDRASWDGDAEDFVSRIATARTFGWLAEHAALRARGRAAAVDLDSVLVFDDHGGVLEACRPPDPGEPARHKLLDLIGDLALYGGPRAGRVRAALPGHGATHAVVREALAAGILGNA